MRKLVSLIEEYKTFSMRIIISFSAPVHLDYSVLYFKLSEKVIDAKRDLVKVSTKKPPPSFINRFIFCCIAVHSQHSSSQSPLRVREQGHHPRQVHLGGQGGQDDHPPRQGEQGPAKNRRRGSGRDQPDPPDQAVDEVSQGEPGRRHQGSD